ncbi:ISAzo13 family transposase [bacterium]|nr:ISAzo13 family transposase [bacterium]
MGFTLKKNQKRRGGSQHPGRDEQFRYIADRRAAFAAAGLPVLSIDTKEKALIGDFRNPGRAWQREPDEVNDHDFTSTAECRTVPFEIYDVGRNRGHVRVGVSNDTPEFAVSAVAERWRAEGRAAYPGAGELLVLADCGGTNGHRHRAWKLNLQEKLCDGLGLVVTVCHYPPGCSKWNPIEHRLFSQISTNWSGKPLRSLDLMLGYIRGTTMRTGLTVTAVLDETTYKKGQKVSMDDVRQLRVREHATCPEWNYTISPRDTAGHNPDPARSCRRITFTLRGSYLEALTQPPKCLENREFSGVASGLLSSRRISDPKSQNGCRGLIRGSGLSFPPGVNAFTVNSLTTSSAATSADVHVPPARTLDQSLTAGNRTATRSRLSSADTAFLREWGVREVVA